MFALRKNKPIIFDYFSEIRLCLQFVNNCSLAICYNHDYVIRNGIFVVVSLKNTVGNT